MVKSTSTCLFLALLFAIGLEESEEAKILALFPVAAKSHMSSSSSLAIELAKRGHEVTVVSPFPQEKPIPNYKDIALTRMNLIDVAKSLGRGGGEKQMNTFEMDRGYIGTLFFLWPFGNFMCDYYLAQEEMQNLMKSNEKYDLIIQQNFFLDCFLGFSHKFQAPLIQLVTFAGSETMGDVVGNPAPYAYVPDPFSSNGDKMDFMGRLFNTLGQLFQKVGHKLYHMPNQDKIMRKYFKDQYMPYIGDLEKKTALLLVNHHFSLSYPKPMVPNYVQVGGMHVKPPKKLPEDLQKYIDEAPDGVIYFSMGSNLKSSDMSKETVQSFIEAFKSLKQRVLWKWEDDMLPGQPQNLRIQKWFPQSDILAHPNVRLFITHGGLLSTQETFNRGVPIVGIPILGDQRLNMALCENLGCGIKLEFKNITTESILWAVKQVIENPKYRENVQRLSAVYKDQPLTPMETAVFWTEYVIRHKGAPHMRSAAINLTWYQYYLLDVIAVLAIAASIVLLIPVVILRALYKKCFGTKVKPQVSSNKKRKEAYYKYIYFSQIQFAFFLTESFVGPLYGQILNFYMIPLVSMYSIEYR